jgi:hypothetical protein
LDNSINASRACCCKPVSQLYGRLRQGNHLNPDNTAGPPASKKVEKKKRHKHAAFLRLGLPEQYKGKERRVFKIPKKP